MLVPNLLVSDFRWSRCIDIDEYIQHLLSVLAAIVEGTNSLLGHSRLSRDAPFCAATSVFVNLRLGWPLHGTNYFNILAAIFRPFMKFILTEISIDWSNSHFSSQFAVRSSQYDRMFNVHVYYEVTCNWTSVSLLILCGIYCFEVPSIHKNTNLLQQAR
jgi:hypothetical protein